MRVESRLDLACFGLGPEHEFCYLLIRAKFGGARQPAGVVPAEWAYRQRGTGRGSQYNPYAQLVASRRQPGKSVCEYLFEA